MNHARIAAEALRFRLGTFASGTADQGNGATPHDSGFNATEAGEILAACGDPGVDSALRLLGETWQAAGLPVSTMDRPWSAGDAARLRTVGGVRLLDTLDELVTGVSRCRLPH